MLRVSGQNCPVTWIISVNELFNRLQQMQASGTQISIGDLKGFAVHPKTDCPHVETKHINNTYRLLDTLKGMLLPGVCKDCGSQQENWICLTCNSVFCSRYVKAHMSEHCSQTGHHVTFSFTDGSIWCYGCDSYITSSALNYLVIKFSSIKFPDGDDTKDMEELTKLLERSLEIAPKKQESAKKQPQKKPEPEEQQNKYTREQFVRDIKQKKANKIVFLTGAGISVSAGIPDFRSPGSGLYSQLAKYNLPRPQSVFEIDFFKANPEPFYKLSKQLFSAKSVPTISHRFIKKIDDQQQLLRTITQNIDSLELAAGLTQSKLIQAHGHSRSVHCLDCSKECDSSKFLEAIMNEKVMRCLCGGLAKPDITFFGEALPPSFKEAYQNVNRADLVIVMGTSLVVFPFAFLIQLVKEKTPIVLINNTNSLGHKTPNALWLDGDLDQRVAELCEALDWNI